MPLAELRSQDNGVIEEANRILALDPVEKKTTLLNKDALNQLITIHHTNRRIQEYIESGIQAINKKELAKAQMGLGVIVLATAAGYYGSEHFISAGIAGAAAITIFDGIKMHRSAQTKNK